MGNVYKNPPLIEALCEFQFKSSQPWDWTVPGLLYAQIENQYPKKRQRNAIAFEASATPAGVTQNVQGGVERMLFLRKDEHALVQVGPNLLAINHLRPYPNWETFRKMITEILTAYLGITQPDGFESIALRYINRIELQETNPIIHSYYSIAPRVPANGPPHLSLWAQRLEIPYAEANGIMILQSGSLHEENVSFPVFMLDLEFRTLDSSTITFETAFEWIEAAHSNIENTFETCITDHTRQLFGEKKNDNNRA